MTLKAAHQCRFGLAFHGWPFTGSMKRIWYKLIENALMYKDYNFKGEWNG